MTKTTEPSEPVLNKVTPILFVRDVTASAGFFRDSLGFTVDFMYGSPPFYGSVSRDGVCLHLRYVDRPNFTDLAAREESLILATIEVSSVQSLFDEFKGRGVTFRQPVIKQPWGGTDFHIADPDGNVVSFVAYG